MLMVKDYILIWTIFKLSNTFIINNDRNIEEVKRKHFKGNFNEFIKQSKKVITSLNEDILRSNNILDRIADDSNRIDRMSGFEDQQIKKIEEQLESKALNSLGSAQLIGENFFQLNKDSSLKVDQTTLVQKIPVLKKKRLSSNALQGLYRQIFSHISFQDPATNNSHETVSTTSLFKPSEDPATQPYLTKEASSISLEKHSESSTTLPLSTKDLFYINIENLTVASTTEVTLNKETSISLENYSDSSSTQSLSNREIFTILSNLLEASKLRLALNKESTTSLDNKTEASMTLPVSNKETSKSLNSHSDASITPPISNKVTYTSLDTSMTPPVSTKETSTSLDSHSDTSITLPVSNKEIATDTEKYSDTSMTPSVSNKESSLTSIDSHSDTSITLPVSNKEIATDREKYSDTSMTPSVSNKESSLTSIDNRSESSTTQPVSNSELFYTLPQLSASKVIPVNHLNGSHICIDIGEICNENETREHIKKESEENPDLKAETDTSPPTENVITTTVSTTRKSFYPSALTLLKPTPLVIVDTTTARPLTTLGHMEFVGQITCRWICDSENVKTGANGTNKKAFHFNSNSIIKRESGAPRNKLVLPSTNVRHHVKEMDISNSGATIISNHLKTKYLAHGSTNKSHNFIFNKQNSAVDDINNSSCSDNDSFQTNYMPEGVTMTCRYSDLPPPTPVVCTTEETIAGMCDLISKTENTPEISALPEQLSTNKPEMSVLPERLMTSEPPMSESGTSELPKTLPSTERISLMTEKPAYIGIHTTKLEHNVPGSSETYGSSKPSAAKNTKKWSLLIPVCLFGSE